MRARHLGMQQRHKMLVVWYSKHEDWGWAYILKSDVNAVLLAKSQRQVVQVMLNCVIWVKATWFLANSRQCLDWCGRLRFPHSKSRCSSIVWHMTHCLTIFMDENASSPDRGPQSGRLRRIWAGGILLVRSRCTSSKFPCRVQTRHSVATSTILTMGARNGAQPIRSISAKDKMSKTSPCSSCTLLVSSWWTARLAIRGVVGLGRRYQWFQINHSWISEHRFQLLYGELWAQVVVVCRLLAQPCMPFRPGHPSTNIRREPHMAVSKWSLTRTLDEHPVKVHHPCLWCTMPACNRLYLHEIRFWRCLCWHYSTNLVEQSAR